MRGFDIPPLPTLTVAAILCFSAFIPAQTPAVNPTAPDSNPVPVTAAPQAASVPVASTIEPKTPPTPVQMGDALMAHQRYQAAIEAYKKAPPDAEVWNKLGIAYQLMFNVQEAMHCYKTSFKLDPKNPTVINNLGTAYDALKQYESAERMYRKALKIDPHSALILKNLGTNLLAQHKFSKGWASYQAALKIDPQIFTDTSRPRIENPASISDRGAMNFYLAKGCVKAGMPLRAIEYLRMALNEGYTSPKKIIADNEFAALHGLPEFEELLNSQTQKRQ